jgi:DNA-binding LacI/PurR family transcriptional regulator
VRPETRERVHQAIALLGYRPNAAARSLVTRRSRSLGVVCLDTIQYSSASILDGIEHAAQDAGYVVSVTSLRQGTIKSAAQVVDRLAEQLVDGILLMAPEETTAASLLRALPAGMPVVAVESALAGARSVVVDQALGARLVTEHLLSLGHDTVYHVRGPSGWHPATRRLDGWRTALKDRDARVPKPLLGDWTAHGGYLAGQKLARDPRVTAVFAANDYMALGVLRALREAGRRVPDDLSVAGFDDIPEAAYVAPTLTTVAQPFHEVGRRSVQMLLDEIDGTTVSSSSTALRPEPVFRQSVAAR